jgi:ribosomal protein L2
MQQRFLDLIEEYNGDLVAAARAAGYKQPYRAVKEMRKEIAEVAESVLAGHSVNAAIAVVKIMNSKEGVVQAEQKLKAASVILDRTNPKTERLDVSHEGKGGIFILPMKREED